MIVQGEQIEPDLLDTQTVLQKYEKSNDALDDLLSGPKLPEVSNEIALEKPVEKVVKEDEFEYEMVQPKEKPKLAPKP